MIDAPETVLDQAGGAVFDLVPLPLLICATDGLVRAANRAAGEFTGRASSEMLGHPIASLFAEDPDTVREAVGRWQRSGTMRPAGLTLRLVDGDVEPVRACGARVAGTDTVLVQLQAKSDAARQFAYLSRDVEVRDLRELRARLQHTLHELSRSNRRLAATNEELERYASLISHDLRGPLSAIRQFAELMRTTDAAKDEDVEEMIAAISRLSEKASSVTDSLLHLARTGSFDGIPGPASADKALKVALGQLGVEDSRDVEVVAGRLPEVMVHAAHLTQIFANLIGNSVRYRAEDRPLRVEVSAHTADGWARFLVADNGVGVPESDRERIFKPNVRGSQVQDHDGAGLGLALCRRIVSGYGGHIEVAESDAPGAAFAFRLPSE